MRTNFTLSHLSGVCAVATLIVISGCRKSEQEAPPPSPSPKPEAKVETPASGMVSAEKNSYHAVAKHLDHGGNFYLYLGTEQWLKGLSAEVGGWRQIFINLPDVSEEDRTEINRVFDIGTRLVRNSGIEEISGVGVSGIAREPGLYYARSIIHHYPGEAKGFVWSLPGGKPHPLDALDLMPANTAMAFYSDFDLTLLWKMIEREMEQSGFPQAAQAMDEAREGFRSATGQSLDKVLASLGGEYGVIVTLNPGRMTALPIPKPDGRLMEIPEPGLVLLVKVKDDLVFNMVEKSLAGQQVQRVDEPGLKMRTMQMPLPLPVRPTIAQAQGYLMFATTDTAVREVLAVKSGKSPGLKSTPEFTRLSQGVPGEGNAVGYVSQRFTQLVTDLQLMGMQSAASGQNPSEAAFMKALMSKLVKPGGGGTSYFVFANTDEGWLTTGNGTQQPAAAMAGALFVGPMAMLSAIAIPNFVRARETAQRNVCRANLRHIDGATQQWALENKKRATDRVSKDAISEYLKGGRLPVCPAGGEYELSTVEHEARCSLHGAFE